MRPIPPSLNMGMYPFPLPTLAMLPPVSTHRTQSVPVTLYNNPRASKKKRRLNTPRFPGDIGLSIPAPSPSTRSYSTPSQHSFSGNESSSPSITPPSSSASSPSISSSSSSHPNKRVGVTSAPTITATALAAATAVNGNGVNAASIVKATASNVNQPGGLTSNGNKTPDDKKRKKRRRRRLTSFLSEKERWYCPFKW
jgi:hypothetical protein